MRNQRLPGLHITGHQMRLYMSPRHGHQQAAREGWPAARFATLAEQELADRGRRRIERHLAEARQPAERQGRAVIRTL
jgi:hypothetical protein